MIQRHRDQLDPIDSTPLRQRTPRSFAVTITVLYTVTVLVLAMIASNYLYDWARLRILTSSSLSDIANISAFTPVTLQKPQADTHAGDTVQAAAVNGQALAQGLATSSAAVPAINVLLLGTDARPDDPEPPRTDTMILLTLDPQTQTAGILSFPRDLWMPIPGFGFSTKINTAYTIGETREYPGGGAQLAKDSISSFVGQPVQYYLRVNFNGFVELVDLIGGIDIVVPETIHDDKYPTEDYGYQTFHLDAGKQHLDGKTTLQFVRTRNTDDDYSRARRQQLVIRAMADKALRADMLPALLPRLPRLLYTMRSSIETDIPMALQLEFANYVRDSSLQEVRQLVLDSQFGEETYSEEGAWILRPNRAKVRSALVKFFESKATASDGQSAVAMADPAWVRIEILNGTGEPGAAARTRDLLQSQGWKVVSIGDADRSDYGRTIIINYGVPEEFVAKVGVDLDLEPDLSSLHGLNLSSAVDVRIVVGRDVLEHIDQ